MDLKGDGIFLTSFLFHTWFGVEMDISYHFHKIRSKWKISLVFLRVKKAIFRAWVKKNMLLVRYQFLINSSINYNC